MPEKESGGREEGEGRGGKRKREGAHNEFRSFLSRPPQANKKKKKGEGPGITMRGGEKGRGRPTLPFPAQKEGGWNREKEEKADLVLSFPSRWARTGKRSAGKCQKKGRRRRRNLLCPVLEPRRACTEGGKESRSILCEKRGKKGKREGENVSMISPIFLVSRPKGMRKGEVSGSKRKRRGATKWCPVARKGGKDLGKSATQHGEGKKGRGKKRKGSYCHHFLIARGRERNRLAGGKRERRKRGGGEILDSAAIDVPNDG